MVSGSFVWQDRKDVRTEQREQSEVELRIPALLPDDYIPDSVLWRRKDGMSDGVSGHNKKWYQHIQDYVDTIITDEEYREASNKFPSKEAYYYKKVYDEQFPTYQPTYEYWLPKWVNHGGDPSGRILTVFNE